MGQNIGWRDEDGIWQNGKEMGIMLLELYVEEYMERDSNYKIIATEIPFRTPVTVRQGHGRPFSYAGTIDGVWYHMYDKRLIMVDHKTTSQLVTEYLTLDEQSGSYLVYGQEALRRNGRIPKNQTIDHIMFNFLRKGKPDTRPKNNLGQSLNKDGTVSKVQHSPLFHREIVYRDTADRKSLRRRVRQEWAEMEMARSGKLSIYKAPSRFNCQSCGFFQICQLHEYQADWQSLATETMEHWEPYSAQELLEDGKN
jgi:hypothetical protein